MALKDFQDRRDSLQLTIANGANISGSVDMAGMVPVGIIMPATWTVAVMGFSVSIDNVNFFPLKSPSGDAEVSIAVSQGNAYVFVANALNAGLGSPMILSGFRYWKVRSGTVTAPVNQNQASIVTLVLTPGV